MIQYAASLFFSCSQWFFFFPLTPSVKRFLPPAIRSDWLSHPCIRRRYANEVLTKRLIKCGMRARVCLCVRALQTICMHTVASCSFPVSDFPILLIISWMCLLKAYAALLWLTIIWIYVISKISCMCMDFQEPLLAIGLKQSWSVPCCADYVQFYFTYSLFFCKLQFKYQKKSKKKTSYLSWLWVGRRWGAWPVCCWCFFLFLFYRMEAKSASPLMTLSVRRWGARITHLCVFLHKSRRFSWVLEKLLAFIRSLFYPVLWYLSIPINHLVLVIWTRWKTQWDQQAPQVTIKTLPHTTWVKYYSWLHQSTTGCGYFSLKIIGEALKNSCFVRKKVTFALSALVCCALYWMVSKPNQ